MSKNDNLREIYSQHWQHMRHIANERLAFTSFYFAFLGAGLVFIFKSNDLEIIPKSAIIGLLLLLSIFGFLSMIRFLMSFWYHYMEIKRITPILCPDEIIDYEGKQENVEEEIKKSEKSWLNHIYIWIAEKCGLMPLTLIFPTIFLICIIGLIVLLTLAILQTI